MRIGCLGDLHFRKTRPIHRVDEDYYDIQFSKFNQALSHFKKRKCGAIIAPGDVFNSYGRDPYSLVNDVAYCISKYDIPFYVVFGQHDLKFHNLEITDVPLRVLASANLVTVLDYKGTNIGANVFLYGASFNENIPIPTYLSSNICNILVAHKMIIPDRKSKLWPGQTDYITTGKLMKKYPYNLFVTGDNHQFFVIDEKVVNCGSLCRMNVDQGNHTPSYAIYNTKTKKLKGYQYSIKQNVLQEVEFSKKKQDKKRTSDFANSLKADFEADMNYRNNVNAILKKKRRVKKRTKEILEEALNAK